MEKEIKKPPIKVFQCGSVQAAIWLFPTVKDGKVVEKHSVTITKTYWDKGIEDWEKTDFLYPDDLPKVAMVATEAYKHIRMQTFDPRMSQGGHNEKSQLEQTEDFPKS